MTSVSSGEPRHGLGDGVRARRTTTRQDRLPTRVALGRLLGRVAEAASRASGRGAGGVIGGRVMLAIAPDSARELARGRDVVLVSGTNGKTTTTACLAAALGCDGPVTTNTDGANTPAGLARTLAQRPAAARVVLETDEGWLAWTRAQTGASTAVLLNLSRDQLHRHHEVAALAAAWVTAVDGLGHVVANADDPDVVMAALAAQRQTWVSVGIRWTDDALLCPRCGQECRRTDADWWCSCGLRRPEPDWWLEGEDLVSRTERIPLQLSLPGRANLGNAAMAVAAAADFGVDPRAAAQALRGLSSVAGRYEVVERDGRRARLVLAKNPASWVEALEMLPPAPAPVVLAFNSEGVDGRDPSWLYDVPFGAVGDRPVVVTGRRATDMMVRLEVEGFEDVRRAPSVAAALQMLPPGEITVVGNYTAFQETRKELRHGH
jgi:UDP-N-acetylmuramyl tripeptide synthase